MGWPGIAVPSGSAHFPTNHNITIEIPSINIPSTAWNFPIKTQIILYFWLFGLYFCYFYKVRHHHLLVWPCSDIRNNLSLDQANIAWFTSTTWGVCLSTATTAIFIQDWWESASQLIILSLIRFCVSDWEVVKISPDRWPAVDGTERAEVLVFLFFSD